MTTYTTKQWFELHGNIVTCKTEMDGFATESYAFLSGDRHQDLAILNEMIARGKKEVAMHVEKRKPANDAASIVRFGDWNMTTHSGGIGVVKCDPLSEGVFPLTTARRSLQPVIEKVIFNAPATIVFWSDGDKTVVKATNEPFDREKGLAMAISKKFLGGKGNYFNTFRKFIEEEE